MKLMESLDPQSDILKHGWQLHQQGQHAQAEELYRRALDRAPGNPAALYCIGRLAFDVRNFDIAADYLARATAGDPSQSLFHADLAQALQMLGRFGEAIATYRRAIELEPDRAGVYVNLGNAQLQSGQTTDAISSYRRALECDATLADAHSCLGVALQAEGHGDEAAACYRRAIELRPDYVQAHFNLGTLLTCVGEPSAALPSLQKAVELAPDSAAVHHNLGVALNQLGQAQQARQCFETALGLDDSNAKCHFNLGEVLEQQGQVEEALIQYDRSLRLDPQYGQARCTRGTALLKLGHFQAGWRDYESRVGLPQYDTLTFRQPLWDGSQLTDRTLLVHCEQGLGDTLQFIRYVKLVRQRAAHVTVASRAELIPLLNCSGFASLVSRSDPLPPFDVHAPLLSLPRIFGTEVDSVPDDVPYLAADEELIEKWRKKLEAHGGFKIGIHWQGNPIYRYDRFRSIAPEQFAPLGQVPGVVLFGLQKRGGPEGSSDVLGTLSIHDLGPELDNDSGAFIDLVITSDTAAAHLAGGLGARVWVALGTASEWRWLLGREDSPWYPTMRLFRQPKPGDWSAVFERMAAELAQLVSSAPTK
jgi:tetratricopeptide (TPR) repeat protein